jgi:hypothetical protein
LLPYKAKIRLDFSEVLMTEPISRLELLFGLPSTDEKEELTSKRAIEHDVSVERVLLVDFEHLVNTVWMKRDGENIFELLIFIHAEKAVVCSDVSFDTYLHNGYRYPKVVINSDHVKIKNSDQRLWLSNNVVEAIGRDLDDYFEYAFVGFRRTAL